MYRHADLGGKEKNEGVRDCTAHYSDCGAANPSPVTENTAMLRTLVIHSSRNPTFMWEG